MQWEGFIIWGTRNFPTAVGSFLSDLCNSIAKTQKVVQIANSFDCNCTYSKQKSTFEA